MLHYLLSAIDDALDTLYEPNVVFRQLLGSASMIIFSLSLSLLPLLVLSFLVFSFLSFHFSFLRFLVSSFISFIFFSFLSSFFSNWLASAVRMRGDRYHVQYIRGSLSLVANCIVGFSRRE